MPAMQFGATDQIIENTKTQIDIAVLEKSIDRIKYEVRGQYRWGDAENDKW